MGDPVSLIAVTALSAASSVMGGMASAKASALEAQQYREAAADRRIQAQQEAAQVAEEADRMRRRNIAVRAASGLDTGSASFGTIQTEIASDAADEIANIRFQGASEASRYELSAKQSQIAGKSAMRGGLLGGGTSLLRGYRSYKKFEG